MPTLATRLFFLLTLFSGIAQPLFANPSEIRPPFGLKWLERTERMTSLLHASKASVTEKRVLNGREAWTVEGLTQPGLRRTIFYFTNQELVEIELQYEHANWNEAKYNNFFDQVKKRIEAKHGVGQLLAQTTAPKSDVQQKILGYQWEQHSTALQIFYYSAERGAMAYRAVSLHYKMR